MFGFAVGLGDGRVEIDHQLFAPSRAGARRPRVGQQPAVHLVELADMTERERPEERADRRRCQRHEPQHLPGGTRTQSVQRINVGCTGDHAHHDRHHLGRSVRDTGVNPPADQTRQAETALPRVAITTGPNRTPDSADRRPPRPGQDCAKMYSQKVPFWTGDDAASNTVILPALKALSAYARPRRPLPGRCIQAYSVALTAWPLRSATTTAVRSSTRSRSRALQRSIAESLATSCTAPSQRRRRIVPSLPA